jgi:hypothetical protein
MFKLINAKNEFFMKHNKVIIIKQNKEFRIINS